MLTGFFGRRCSFCKQKIGSLLCPVSDKIGKGHFLCFSKSEQYPYRDQGAARESCIRAYWKQAVQEIIQSTFILKITFYCEILHFPLVCFKIEALIMLCMWVNLTWSATFGPFVSW
jgi:hypothetical protein